MSLGQSRLKSALCTGLLRKKCVPDVSITVQKILRSTPYCFLENVQNSFCSFVNCKVQNFGRAAMNKRRQIKNINSFSITKTTITENCFA